MLKTGKDLAQACRRVATEYKTLYVLGCIGAPMNVTNKARYCANLEYNRDPVRSAKIKSATASTFGFDCVCMIKSLLWGWQGDKKATYGGAKYASNNVPDISADQMIKVCRDVSTDFSRIQVGEALWMKGHIGVYIGDGLAVECTPRWKDGVQLTAVHNIGKKEGYNGRKWTKHGKLPWLEYGQEVTLTPAASRTKSLAGTYTVVATNGLRLRQGPGTEHPILEVMAHGSAVRCYGYHTGSWLAVVSPGGQTGYCSSRYLVRKSP